MEDCAICYQIKCKKCDWVVTDKEVEKIQKGEMIACPVCRWKPGEN